MARIFGLQFKRNDNSQNLKSFAEPQYDDGSVVVAGGMYGTYVDLEGTIRNESDLVSKYRNLALQPEIDRAVNEVVNESIIIEDGLKIVEIILDDVPIDDNIKKLITMEFENILDVLNFNNNGYDIFKKWYIDGRAYYHAIFDEKAPMEGIKELRPIDPRKIRKIREVKKNKDPDSGAMLTETTDEYYIYNEQGLSTTSKFETNSNQQGVKISKDSIIYQTSGLIDAKGQLVLSYLHPAMKPMNQLRSIEDSTLIYHLSRAPERRVFYVDTGSMPHFRAKQYMEELVNSYRTKLTYNAETGEVKDTSKTMSMLEDYWMQVREGGRGTKVETMSGGTQLSQLLETVQLFEDKLYKSLQVPISRLKQDDTYTMGRATEISRDEINFAKFIDRVRNKFSVLFVEALEKQLVLKNIVTPDDFDFIRNKIKFKYLKDNLFSELKEHEIMKERMNVLGMMMPWIGRFYSNDWVRKNVCKQSEETIEEEDQLIGMEMSNPQFMPPEEEQGEPQ
tara:strand:- start:765 stop:2282 length:1518 start_codon:yes stop_codon:yes gene_type:complete